MPWDGSGGFAPPAASFPEVNGTVIDADRYNPTILDLASGIEAALAKNGENAATANIPMGSFKLTGLAAGSAAGDSVRWEQVLKFGYSDIASAGTTELGGSGNGVVRITGTTTITAFGSTAPAGAIYCLVFAGALTLTHHATDLILPGGANITTAAGDCALVHHYASGDWRCIGYQRGDGSPLYSARISALLAANAANTLANGNNAQTWNWAITTANRVGLTLGETSAATGSDAIILKVGTAASSTAWPLQVQARGADALTVNELGQVAITAAGGQALRIGASEAGTAPTGTGAISILGQQSSGASAGGITIAGGTNTSSGDGGDITITGGLSTGGSNGNLTATGEGAVINGLSELRLVVSAGNYLNLRTAELAVSAPSAAPTIASGGGSGASIRGTDVFFEVTFGTGSPTSVTVAFNQTKSVAPMVVATGSTSGQIIHVASVSTTQVQISSSTAFASGAKVGVMCMTVV